MTKYTVAGIVLMVVLALRFLGLLGMVLNLLSSHALVALIYLVLAGICLYAFWGIFRRNKNGVMVTAAVALIDLLAVLINSRNFYGAGVALIDLALLYFAWKEYKNQAEDSLSSGSGASPPSAPAAGTV